MCLLSCWLSLGHYRKRLLQLSSAELRLNLNYRRRNCLPVPALLNHRVYLSCFAPEVCPVSENAQVTCHSLIIPFVSILANVVVWEVTRLIVLVGGMFTGNYPNKLSK